jgi:hypothetical protein
VFSEGQAPLPDSGLFERLFRVRLARDLIDSVLMVTSTEAKRASESVESVDVWVVDDRLCAVAIIVVTGGPGFDT